FFFFQAEDGIRDLYVTGVQTCALPILTFVPVSKSRHGYHHWLRSALVMRGSGQVHAVRNAVQSAWFGAGSDRELARVGAHGYDRSEERRVGKECRSRWSRNHEKKRREE